MIPIPSGVKVWLATGHTDMRRGFPELSLMVRAVLPTYFIQSARCPLLDGFPAFISPV